MQWTSTKPNIKSPRAELPLKKSDVNQYMRSGNHCQQTQFPLLHPKKYMYRIRHASIYLFFTTCSWSDCRGAQSKRENQTQLIIFLQNSSKLTLSSCHITQLHTVFEEEPGHLMNKDACFWVFAVPIMIRCRLNPKCRQTQGTRRIK